MFQMWKPRLICYQGWCGGPQHGCRWVDAAYSQPQECRYHDDADLVAFLCRDDYYNEFSQDERIAELIIKKKRDGPTGVVALKFHKKQMRFSDYF